MKQKILVYLIIVIILLISYVIINCVNTPGKYDDFAKCLTEKGVIMGGTDWCHFCKAQKELFGRSFKFIQYKNCDFNKEWCNANNIKSYPIWVLPDGTKQTGVQKLSMLSELSGCGLE